MNIEAISKKLRDLKCPDFIKGKDYLLQIQKEGELFNQSYSDNDLSIYFLSDKMLDILLKDLGIRLDDSSLSIKLENPNYSCTIRKSRLLENNCVFSCYDTSQSRTRICLIYAIALVLFRTDLSKYIYDVHTAPYILNFSPEEEAFIYALLMPYKRYKHCLEDFMSTDKPLSDWYIFLSSHNALLLFIAIQIDKFYASLYFEDLKPLWKKLINIRNS